MAVAMVVWYIKEIEVYAGINIYKQYVYIYRYTCVHSYTSSLKIYSINTVLPPSVRNEPLVNDSRGFWYDNGGDGDRRRAGGGNQRKWIWQQHGDHHMRLVFMPS